MAIAGKFLCGALRAVDLFRGNRVKVLVVVTAAAGKALELERQMDSPRR